MVDFDARSFANKDYYYTLGVRPDATSEEIQDAYHELYEKFGPHVDNQGTDNDLFIKTFKEINTAYEVLMDPASRHEYDKNTTQSRQSTSELRNIWTRTTGGHKAAERAPQSAPSYEIEVELTLKEAFKGSKKSIKINDLFPCTYCGDKSPMHRRQCHNCHGLGYYPLDRDSEIEIPAGSTNGQEIRIRGEGRTYPATGQKGDLIVKIKLEPHPILGVLGRDITCNIPVTLYEAMLGAEIEVPTVTGKVMMKVQPLSQPGRVYRLKGLGLGGADQLVTIDVQIPQQLSGEEVALYHKLKAMSKAPNPRDKFFGK